MFMSKLVSFAKITEISCETTSDASRAHLKYGQRFFAHVSLIDTIMDEGFLIPNSQQ